MVSDANTDGSQHPGTGTAAGRSWPAEPYCSHHGSFLCRGCDVRVHAASGSAGCDEPAAAASDKRAAAAVPPATAATTVTSDVSGSATLGGAAAEALKPSYSLYTAESAPAAPAASADRPSAFPSASCGGASTAPSHTSPFAFMSHRGLGPPPPLPRTTAADGAPPLALRLPQGNSLDQELMDCLESLTTDPLAPLDFGFDLGRLGAPLTGLTAAAADLAAPLESAIACPPELDAPTAASLARPAAAPSAAAERKSDGEPVGLSSSSLWRAYRPTGEEQQVVVVEERAPPPRKRAAEDGAGGSSADGDARGAARVKAEQALEVQQVPRNWAAPGGVGAVVTTGIVGRNAVAALVASLSLQLSAGPGPATPTADAAFPPTMGSFIWQQAQPHSPPAGGAAAAAAPLPSPGAPAAAVTTGVAPPAQAVQAAFKPAAAKPARKRDSRRRASAAAVAPLLAVAAAAAAAAAEGGEAARELPPIPLYREGEGRAVKLERYRAKRERRRFKKTVRYECRKHYADMRPRIKGRFVSPEEFAAWHAEHGGEGSEGSLPPAPPAVAAC